MTSQIKKDVEYYRDIISYLKHAIDTTDEPVATNDLIKETEKRLNKIEDAYYRNEFSQDYEDE